MKKIILLLTILTLTIINSSNPTGKPQQEGLIEECTTIVAVGNATSDGSVILGKNRDLSEFELQWLYHSPRQFHPPGSTVKLQYIEIPQAPVTWAWIGSKSYTKKWGIGMGINEWGVAIADNDAPTRERLEGYKGLHDNDICRLVLERAKTAYEGVLLIGKLLEEYGHSFVGQIYWVADANECWIVEGAGRHWAAIKVTNGVEVRANQFQITTNWDLACEDLVEYAIEMGWCESPEDFNFARCYSPKDYPYRSSQTRYERAWRLISPKISEITPNDIMEILSDHYEDTYMYKTAHNNPYYRTICTKRTVASMITHLRPWLPRQLQLIWYAMSSPCISIFIPVYSATTNIPEPYLTGTGGKDMSNYNPNSAWWIFKKLQIIVDEDYDEHQPIIREEWRQFHQQELTQTSSFEEEVSNLLEKGEEEEAIRRINEFVNNKLLKAYHHAKEIIEKLAKPTQPPPMEGQMNQIIGLMVGILVATTALIYWRRKKHATINVETRKHQSKQSNTNKPLA